MSVRVSMACVAPVTRGPNKGKPATGTSAGRRRHYKAGEPVCPDCMAAHNAAASRRYAEDPEKHKERTRRWYAANIEKAAEYNRRYRAANPERMRETARRWYAANGEEKRERERQRYAANPERMRETARRWREANLERERENNRRWREANPEKRLENARRRDALKRNATIVPFTADQLAQRMAYWGNRCWMCGGPFEHVDHVIALALGGPHCLSNLRPACKSCNSSKGAKPLSDLDLPILELSR